MTIDQYIADLNKEYKTGHATEHTYRGYLQQLIKTMVPPVLPSVSAALGGTTRKY